MRLVYCHCAYAQAVPKVVKQDVLRALTDSGVDFDAVADLCEMSARKDPALANLASGGEVTIAACYPRAVKWLFNAAGTPLPETGVRVLNMRVQTAGEVAAGLLDPTAAPAPASEADPEPQSGLARTTEPTS